MVVISTRTLGRIAVASMSVAIAAGSASAQTNGRCAAADVAGYFTGHASSQQSGRFDIILNLWCANGHYTGTLVTPLGTFPIRNGSADSNQVRVAFDVGSDVGIIEATSSDATLRGRFVAAGDSGSIALVRMGAARPPGWDKPTLELTAAQWRQDLTFFAHQIAVRHGNAFHTIPPARFDSLVTKLDSRFDDLNGDQAYVELDRLANLIGDAHTFVAIPEDAPRFPFAVRRFGTEYRVVAVQQGGERLLGSRLLKVGDLPTASAIQRLWSLTPAGEHPSLRQARAESFLGVGTILHGIGITPGRDTVALTLRGDDGATFRIDLPALSDDRAATLAWTDVFRAAPLFALHPTTSFWYQYLPKARTIYCSFRGYDGLSARAPGLLELIRRVRPEKLVIDMRQNGGGDYELGLRALVDPLSRMPSINRRGRLFIAIGPNTFSAGMANAAQFRSRTRAILVGETIGEKPNSFQEPRAMQLPNSHLIVRYSTKYYRFANEGPNAVEPDHRIVPTWDEYRAGHDPVLEWIIRHPHRRITSDSGTS
jgi:hypothetical protein